MFHSFVPYNLISLIQFGSKIRKKGTIKYIYHFIAFLLKQLKRNGIFLQVDRKFKGIIRNIKFQKYCILVESDCIYSGHVKTAIIFISPLNGGGTFGSKATKSFTRRTNSFHVIN